MSHVVIEPPCRVVVVDALQLKERVLVVGDVHGCLEELKALLDKANYLDGRTTVVLAGDVCNKGPLSAETVAFCRESNFLCVRGNHDHAALKVRCFCHHAAMQSLCSMTVYRRHTTAWRPNTRSCCPSSGRG